MTTRRFICNTDKTKIVRKEISSWIDTLNSNYVLTVQFPIQKRSDRYEYSKRMLKSVMKDLEYFLLGNSWYKHHVPFIAFCEKGISEMYHYHIFLYNNNIDLDRMKTAMNKVFEKTGYDRSILYLDPFFTANTSDYCTKEIRADKNEHFDTDNIIISQELFGI